jgi:2-dehydropantoate 2-reductase
MKILVMGAGALGTYFGGRLQAAGHEVTLVARGAHLDALRKTGLRIESPAGDLYLPSVHASDDPAAGGTPDVVLFMVKTYDVEEAGRRLAPVLGPDTIVVTCQNGVGTPERLAPIVGAARVHPGAVYMPADVREPGVVRHSGAFHRLVFGSLSGPAGPMARAFAEAVRKAGPDCEIVDDIRAALWEKFVLLSSLAALTAVTRLDIGPIRDCPETKALLVHAVDEALAVGLADCPTLDPDAGKKALDLMLERMGAKVHASMLDDLQRGRRIELDDLSGEIVRRGRRHGIPTPVHAFVAAVLAPCVAGKPGA